MTRIIRSMRKILTGTMIATYLLVYTAPIAFCATNVPQIKAGVNKPVLRSPASVPAKKNVAAAPSAFKLEGDIALTKGNPKISLSLRDSDVEQVLRMFADKAGLNIVFHSSVTGKVTLDLVNVPLNDAFKVVMQVSDLTYFVDKNTMVVASSSEAKTLNLSKQEMASIPVKYTDAGVMATFLNKNIFSINSPGLSNSEVAITNPAANEILIFGTDNDVKMAKKVVAKFDVKPRSETITVNHTTPKEMADLICNVLLQNSSSSGGGASGGAAGIEGSATGGASDLTLGTGTIACKISNKVTAGTLSSFGENSLSVAYFAQRGTLSIMGGSESQVQMIKDFILKNDKKQPQAYIELSIIELNEDGTRTFNNTWNVYSNFFSGGFSGGTTSNSSVYPMFAAGESYDIIDSASKTDPYKVLYSLKQYTGVPTVTYSMNYLMKNGKGRVLANPRILVTNGEESTIDLTSDYVKTVTSQILTTSGSLTPTVQRTYDIGSDDGIKIGITPFISPDGYVTMNLKPEYSTIKERVTTPNALDPTVEDLQATLLSRRNLDLKNIRIKDGETLAIGGMIREDETKTTSKLPFLGDLPGVGTLFRSSSTIKTKSELVIMITPRIVKESEDLVNNSGTAL